MSKDRFSYSISDRAEDVIAKRMKYGISKNAVINFLIERIPEQEKEIESLRKERDQERDIVAEIEGMYNDQTIQVNNLLRERRIVQEFFGTVKKDHLRAKPKKED